MKRFLLAATMVAGLATAAHAGTQNYDWYIMSFKSGHCEHYAPGPTEMNRQLRESGFASPAMQVYRDNDGQVVMVTLTVKEGTPKDGTMIFLPDAARCEKFRQYEIGQGEILDDGNKQ